MFAALTVVIVLVADIHGVADIPGVADKVRSLFPSPSLPSPRGTK
jgi:hypothetical protein